MATEVASKVTLEDLLKDLGNCGRFQIINFVLTCLPVIYSAVSSLSYVFVADAVDHRCFVPECENAADATYSSGQPWLEYAVGYSSETGQNILRQCSRPAHKEQNSSSSSTCTSSDFTSRLIPCESYVFERTPLTIVNEWDVVCDDAWKRTLVGTVNNLGQLAGLPVAGMISDRVGRRTVLVATCCMSAVLGVSRSFAPNYIVFVLLEFLESALGVGIFTASFVLCLELACAGARVAVGVAQCMSFAIGEVVLGLTAWGLQDWRMQLRVGYAPGVIFIIYAWLLPEPVRWLMARGHSKLARQMLENAARRNGLVLDETRLGRVFGEPDAPAATSTEAITNADAKDDENDAGEPSTTEEARSTTDHVPELKPITISDIVRSKILILRIATCCYCWMVHTFMFYGLSLFSVSLRGNKYLNFILVCLVEIPAYLCMLFVADRLGRRRCVAGGLALASLGCFLIMAPTSEGWRVAFMLVSKFSVTLAFAVLYVYTAELFPTPVRHSLLSFCSMVGRIGSVVAPQTPLLAATVHPLLPPGLFGGMGMVAVLLTLLALPETVRMPLPATVEDAERMAIHPFSCRLPCGPPLAAVASHMQAPLPTAGPAAHFLPQPRPPRLRSFAVARPRTSRISRTSRSSPRSPPHSPPHSPLPSPPHSPSHSPPRDRPPSSPR